jgi:hypothetical protein
MWEKTLKAASLFVFDIPDFRELTFGHHFGETSHRSTNYSNNFPFHNCRPASAVQDPHAVSGTHRRWPVGPRGLCRSGPSACCRNCRRRSRVTGIRRPEALAVELTNLFIRSGSIGDKFPCRKCKAWKSASFAQLAHGRLKLTNHQHSRSATVNFRVGNKTRHHGPTLREAQKQDAYDLAEEFHAIWLVYAHFGVNKEPFAITPSRLKDMPDANSSRPTNTVTPGL